MSNEPIFYVYVYLDPRKPGHYVYGEYAFQYEPFYVGKGNGDRMNIHLIEYNLEKRKNKSFTNKIKKIQRVCECNPIILLYQDQLQEQISFDLEISIIAAVGRKDLKRGPLCNLTDGGEGPTGRIVSEETRRKNSESHKGRKQSAEAIEKTRQANIGRKCLDETKRKIGNANRGKIHSEEQNKQISERFKGKPLTEETKRKMSISRMGRICTEETRRKIGNSNKKSRKYSCEMMTKGIELCKEMSQEKAAKILGISRGTICGWLKQIKRDGCEPSLYYQ